ncbi:hypothetical protein [Argonema galeatum]|nr:hypothetical protein [Argonema galeatum]
MTLGRMDRNDRSRAKLCDRTQTGQRKCDRMSETGIKAILRGV